MKGFTITIVMLLSFLGFGQTVTFELHTNHLTEIDQVYIAGSAPSIGGWQPNKVMLVQEQENVWAKTIDFDNEKSIEFKFTLGTWEREAANAEGYPLSNFVLSLEKDTTIELTITHWTNRMTKAVNGQITGTVKYHRDVKGENVLSRDLVVWLPPNYAEEDNSYPVVYMQDGQNIFDPVTSSYGTDWAIDETCDSLINAGKIPGVIVVGIYNTQDRNEEYHPGKKGDSYMRYVLETIKPLIDSNYRTKSDKEHTIVGGSSSGGTFAFMIAWQYPNVFSKAICLSPAFKINKIDLVIMVNEYNGKKKSLQFYIDNGGIALEDKLQSGIDEMLEALQQKGFKEAEDFLWVKDKEAQHNEAAWAKRFPIAIEWIMRD